MNFYNPKKTFLDLASGYQGNLDIAFNLFEDAWSKAAESGQDNRTFREALGINLSDYEKFFLDEISIYELLKKYGRAAASFT